jgi:gas vesicle protein
MRGFLVGGLVGAAAAMYFSKNNRPMLTSAINWDQAVDKAGQFVRSAKNMWDTTSTVQTSTRTNDNTNMESMENLEKMKSVVKNEPGLEHEVNEILEENGRQPIHN